MILRDSSAVDVPDRLWRPALRVAVRSASGLRDCDWPPGLRVAAGIGKGGRPCDLAGGTAKGTWPVGHSEEPAATRVWMAPCPGRSYPEGCVRMGAYRAIVRPSVAVHVQVAGGLWAAGFFVVVGLPVCCRWMALPSVPSIAWCRRCAERGRIPSWSALRLPMTRPPAIRRPDLGGEVEAGASRGLLWISPGATSRMSVAGGSLRT